MIVRSSQSLSRAVRVRVPNIHKSFFGNSATRAGENRIFSNVRTPDELHTLAFLSATDNRPLITLWTASWCSMCKAIKPLVRDLIEVEKIGEKEGGLGFAEVELDSVLIGDLGMKYMVISHQTLWKTWLCSF